MNICAGQGRWEVVAARCCHFGIPKKPSYTIVVLFTPTFELYEQNFLCCEKYRPMSAHLVKVLSYIPRACMHFKHKIVVKQRHGRAPDFQ
jgi:hypothetical protein